MGIRSPWLFLTQGMAFSIPLQGSFTSLNIISLWLFLRSSTAPSSEKVCTSAIFNSSLLILSGIYHLTQALVSTSAKLPSLKSLMTYLLINLLISFLKSYYYLFMLAVLGLHCCVWAFSSCGEQGLLSRWRGLLITVTSLVEYEL